MKKKSKLAKSKTSATDASKILFCCSQAALADAFTEWDRRYREEPERFESEAVRLLKGTPRSYGEACAPYLLALLFGEV
jgi:hypothetical protein